MHGRDRNSRASPLEIADAEDLKQFLLLLRRRRPRSHDFDCLECIMKLLCALHENQRVSNAACTR